MKQVYKSRSWHITQPLRWGTHQIRILRERGIKSRLIAAIKRIFYPLLRIFDDLLISQLLKREGFMKISLLKGVVRYFHKLLSFLLDEYQDSSPLKPDQITNRTHQIYSDLVSAKKITTKEKTNIL